NKVQLEQIERLTENEIKELLPNVGDRVRFRDALDIKTSKKRSANVGEKNTQHPPKKMKSSSSKEGRKTYIVNILRTNKTYKQKLVDAADSMFKVYSNDWLEERRNINPDWQMIDYENGVINCPFCQTTITPQIRNTRKFYWNYTNIGRHLDLVHPRGGGDDVDVNSVLETTLGDSNSDYDDHATLTTSVASAGSSMRKLKVSLQRIEPTMYNNQCTTFHETRRSPNSNAIQPENDIMEIEPNHVLVALTEEGRNTTLEIENDSDTVNSPKWKEKGIKFGWAKASRRDKYVPCFMMKNGECKWITTKGGLSSKLFVAHEFKGNIDVELKKGKMKDLRKFNKDNNTSFA
ncbi:hypothetical protein HA402_011273, partial [Bradysia odoriphaga]